MYRITFYPEYKELRRARRRRRTLLGLASTLIGVELMAIGALAMSGSLLAEQARELTRALDRLQKRADEAPAETPAVERARELVGLREGRIEWAAKLEGLAGAVPPTLRISGVHGQVGTKRTPTELIIQGDVREGGDPLEGVSSFIEALRQHPGIVDELPVVELGSLKGRSGGEFEIVCRLKAERS